MNTIREEKPSFLPIQVQPFFKSKVTEKCLDILNEAQIRNSN